FGVLLGLFLGGVVAGGDGPDQIAGLEFTVSVQVGLGEVLPGQIRVVGVGADGFALAAEVDLAFGAERQWDHAVVEVCVLLGRADLPVAVLGEGGVAAGEGLERNFLVPGHCLLGEVALLHPVVDGGKAFSQGLFIEVLVGESGVGQPRVGLPFALGVGQTGQGDAAVSGFLGGGHGRVEFVHGGGRVDTDLIQDVGVVPQAQQVHVALHCVE